VGGLAVDPFVDVEEDCLPLVDPPPEPPPQAIKKLDAIIKNPLRIFSPTNKK